MIDMHALFRLFYSPLQVGALAFHTPSSVHLITGWRSSWSSEPTSQLKLQVEPGSSWFGGSLHWVSVCCESASGTAQIMPVATQKTGRLHQRYAPFLNEYSQTARWLIRYCERAHVHNWAPLRSTPPPPCTWWCARPACGSPVCT